MVVEINKDNRELVSTEHNGMIVNPDATTMSYAEKYGRPGP